MSATQSTRSSVFSLVALTDRQFPPRLHRRQPWQMLSLPWQGLSVYSSFGKTETHSFFLSIWAVARGKRCLCDHRSQESNDPRAGRKAGWLNTAQ